LGSDHLISGKVNKQLERLASKSKGIKSDLKGLEQNLEVKYVKMKVDSDNLREKVESASKSSGSLVSQLRQNLLTQSMIENLIDDLMDFAKMDNNSFVLNQTFFNLEETISEAFNILKQGAYQKQIKFSAKMDKKENLKFTQAIYGDKRRFL